MAVGTFDKITDIESKDFINEVNEKTHKTKFLNVYGIFPSLIILILVVYKLFILTDHADESRETLAINQVYQEQEYAIINNEIANLRDQPSVSGSKILAIAHSGDKLILISQTANNWFKVLTVNNDTAFVHGNLANLSKEFIKHEVTQDLITDSEKLIVPETISTSDETPYLRYILLGITLIPIILWNNFLFRRDKKRKSIDIIYELDENIHNIQLAMLSSFKSFSNSRKKWQVFNKKINDNIKYNAGASLLIERKELKGVYAHKLPSPFFVANIKIPTIVLSNIELYFLPDLLLLKRHKNFAAVQYKNLIIDVIPTRYRESEGIPSDSIVTDYTYQYINKDGGPDRRFGYNPKIPICAYSQYNFTSEGGINESIMTSKSNAMDDFVIQLKSIGEKQLGISTTNIKSDQPEKSTILSNKPKSKGNIFSEEYYNLLMDISNRLSNITDKLKFDESFTNNSLISLDNKTAETFVPYCVLYDMIQTLKILSDRRIKRDSVEMTGLCLLSNMIIEMDTDWLTNDYETLSTYHSSGIFKNVADKIIGIGNDPNPIKIVANETIEGEISTSKKIKNILALPATLKILNHPLFDDYVTILYRFATIIAKADGQITKKEEIGLKEIYQITHNPNIEEKNKAIKISEVDAGDTLDDVLEELNGLIGLNEVKKEVKTLINFVQIQKERVKQGLKSPQISYHCVFTGSPGTGKTTIARLISKIYKHLGILEKGHLVETDRSDLVASYVGQTSSKVDNVVKTALDGILFIDEAYALASEQESDFGDEAISTIIKRMEDYRDRLVLIVAGYPDEMKSFIDSNPGFKSRFNRYIHFPDYTPEEMIKIYELFCSKSEYTISVAAKSSLAKMFNQLYDAKTKNFGNGRLVRNIFEKSIENQSNRIAAVNKLTKEILTTIEVNDIPNYVEERK